MFTFLEQIINLGENPLRFKEKEDFIGMIHSCWRSSPFLDLFETKFQLFRSDRSGEKLIPLSPLFGVNQLLLVKG